VEYDSALLLTTAQTIRIGLVSDTHGLVRDEAVKVLDVIAGDRVDACIIELSV
jgi:hypothetical protein